jgi:hypothetical protein
VIRTWGNDQLIRIVIGPRSRGKSFSQTDTRWTGNNWRNKKKEDLSGQ